MYEQRWEFILQVTLLAAAATPALAQTTAPAVGPANSAHVASPIPDFSGVWTHPFWPSFDPPLSGPGPITNKSRRPDGAGNSNQ
jgi:hypothetical protein